jgi:hypothetical protein
MSKTDCSHRYNLRYDSPAPLGIEWEESSERYTDYLLVLSMVNLTHPGWGRSLLPPIQIMCAERILLGLNVRNMFVDAGLVWEVGGVVVDVRARVTAVMTPVGFRAMQICDE